MLSFAQPIDAWKHELFDTVDAGFTVAAKDGKLSGKTSEGSDFTLDIDAAGGSKSRGTLTVLGK